MDPEVQRINQETETERILQDAGGWAKRVESFTSLDASNLNINVPEASSGHYSSPPTANDEATVDLQIRVSALEEKLNNTNARFSRLSEEHTTIKALLREASDHVDKLRGLVETYKAEAADWVRAKEQVKVQLDLLKSIKTNLEQKSIETSHGLSGILREINAELDKNPGTIIQAFRDLLTEALRVAKEEGELQKNYHQTCAKMKDLDTDLGVDCPTDFFSREYLSLKNMYLELNKNYVKLLDNQSKRERDPEKRDKIKEIEEKMVRYNDLVNDLLHKSKPSKPLSTISPDQMKDLQSLKSTNSALQKELNNTKMENQRLNNQLLERSQQVDAASANESKLQQQGFQHEMDRLKKENDCLKHTKETLENDNAYLKKLRDDSQRNYDGLFSLLNGGNRESILVKQKADALEEENTVLQTKIRSLETEAADLKKELENAKSVGSKLAEEVSFLKLSRPNVLDLMQFNTSLISAEIKNLNKDENNGANQN